MKPFKNLLKTKPLSGLKLSVMGMARSGISAANLAKRLGAEVLISEIRSEKDCQKELAILFNGIETEFDGHSNRLLGSDLIIKSPGIPHDCDVFKKLFERNIPVISEIEFTIGLMQYKQIIGITGTNGKTTTTVLLGEVFKKSRKTAIVAGNIGVPLSSLVERSAPVTNLILEVSSYQLEDSKSFHPHICAILNITPDHIEHHGTMKNYIKAKSEIFSNQKDSDYCILNYDDLICRKLATKCNSKVIFFSRKVKLNSGVFLAGDRINCTIGGLSFSISSTINIPGKHNIENVLAVVAIAACVGIKSDVIERTIIKFKGVEHRIEFTAEKAGVKYYNDSKSTNVDSTRVALESFSEPIWLILGGVDKKAPYEPLRKIIENKVKGILLIGEAAIKIKNQLSGATIFYECGTLETAVDKAFQLAVRGEIVLLSPACASFDQFSDYEERGRKFKKLVRSSI